MMKFDCFFYTNPGGRDNNEDAIAHSLFPDGGCFVVADGLGGHKNGQLASSAVAEYLNNVNWKIPSDTIQSFLAEQLEAAHYKVCELQTETESQMQTTVVALVCSESQAVCGNVGDSRLYYLRNGSVDYVTSDHSVAYKKYKSGEINKYQINHDADQSRLLRSLGNHSKHEADIHMLDIAPGDGFLLCSDGLWEYLSEEEIQIDFLKSSSAYEWMMLLLLRAVNKMPLDSDNFSAITVIAE